MGCDVVGCHLAVVHGDISIHAPQWGATQHHHHLGAGDQISIHAPQWGATQKSHSIRRNRHHFNPRTPVGCDKPMVDQITEMYEFQSTHPSGVRPGGQGSNAQATSISIHAPQWGATLPQYWHGSVVIFQSTHPSGVRPPGRPVLTARSHFNPRTPVGCDRSCSFEYSFAVISIHAPQWGATGRKLRLLNMQSEFQSTHPSGVRRADDWADLLAEDFNPRTPVGCDPRC